MPGAARGAESAAATARTAARFSVWPWFVLVVAAAALGEWALATRRHGGDA
jgi:hypothetical protein